MVVMIAVSATSAPLTLMPSSSPAQRLASIVRPKDNMNRGDEVYLLTEDLEDYGIWNPSPVYGGGGNAAPIPHPEVKSL